MQEETAKEILAEYVKTAEWALQQAGEDYTLETLEKLAMVLIAKDNEAAMVKEAEEVTYRAFADELATLGVDPLPILKELNKIIE
jgi:hypothetical protein